MRILDCPFISGIHRSKPIALGPKMWNRGPDQEISRHLGLKRRSVYSWWTQWQLVRRRDNKQYITAINWYWQLAVINILPEQYQNWKFDWFVFLVRRTQLYVRDRWTSLGIPVLKMTFHDDLKRNLMSLDPLKAMEGFW